MDRLISEQAVIDTIYESRNNFKNEFDQGFFADKIKGIPPANSQKPIGYWIDNHNGTITCSKCHTWFRKDDRYFYMLRCPYCGTRMESEDDE